MRVRAGAQRGGQAPIYEFTCDLARLAPASPEMQQLFEACLGNQQATDGLLGMVEGTIPVQEFMAPDNMAQIMGAAAMRV